MVGKKLFKVDLIISIMKRPRREYDRPAMPGVALCEAWELVEGFLSNGNQNQFWA